MKLADLIGNLDIVEIRGSINRDIKGIAYNSKTVKEDFIFIAIEGIKLDGHDYIKHAISNGAKVLVVSKDIEVIEGMTIIKVKDTRVGLSSLSAYFYKNPSEKMDLIGITGTNGKTSTAYLLKSILDQSNKSTGLIGTLGTVIKNKNFYSTHTTPESLELQKTFKAMLAEDVDTCVMEVSSHSIQLKRINDCDIDIGIFTNLTHEHLDFHDNIENYYNVKKQLFLKASRLNIINVDDDFGNRLAKEVECLKSSLLTYGINNNANIMAAEILLSNSCSQFQLVTPLGEIDMTINLPGVFNIYNSLAAAACAYSLGVDLKTIKRGLELVTSIPGRFEVIPTNSNFNIIIDYAHTPDGFEKVLETLNEFSPGKIVMVFGCVGERDHTKRRKMGEIAARYADICVLTTDNCRSEDPQKIINDIKEGVNDANGTYVEILDRAEAIRYAILNRKENDTILITGKGHEQQQIIGNHTMYFNEREIIGQTLEELSEQ